MTFIAKKCEFGNQAGKWFTVAIQPGGLTQRIGYCARGCPGHESDVAALAHHLQFQLDRETDLRLERPHLRACEICGVPTTLRARLGRGTKPHVLCTDHQSSNSLQLIFQRRTAPVKSEAPDHSKAPPQPDAEADVPPNLSPGKRVSSTGL